MENCSRSAVIRGRVVTSMNMGLVGVRVSTSTPLEGFTLTRDDGWFDLMVNGGGAITLQFGRSPFRPQSVIVQVPWNEVIIIDTVSVNATHGCCLVKPFEFARTSYVFFLSHFFFSSRLLCQRPKINHLRWQRTRAFHMIMIQ